MRSSTNDTREIIYTNPDSKPPDNDLKYGNDKALSLPSSTTSTKKIAINNDVKLCYNVLSTNNKNGEINSDTDNVLMVKIHQIDDNNKDVTN